MKRLALALPVALLASACVIPVGTERPAGGTPVSGMPVTANGLPTRLDYAGGPIKLGTAEGKGLLALIKDERGQIVAWPLSWSSTAPAVASVDASGQVKALTRGSATIVVALQANPAVRAQIPVEVVTNLSSLGVTITPGAPTIAIGETPLTLRGEVQLADGQVNANVLWSSSDSLIATVNPTTGQVNGLREGQVTIVGTYALDDKIRGQAVVRVVADRGALPSAGPSAVIFRPGAEVGGEGAEAFAQNDGWTRDRIVEKGMIVAIDFVDATTGFGVGDAAGRIQTTFDSGVSWLPVSGRGLAGLGFNDFDFLDAQTGYGAGGSRIQRTRDGGQTWTPISAFVGASGAAVGIAQVKFQDSATGWAAGGGAAFKTTDGGENWGRINTPADLAFEAIAVGGGKVWLLSRGQVHTYADGAWTAAQVIETTSQTGGYLLARQVAFPSATDGWAVGSDAAGLTINRSADGGRTWTRIALKGADGTAFPAQPNPNAAPPAVGFADARHGVATLGDQAYSTSDGGFTWSHKDLKQHHVQQVHALDARHYFMLATPGATGARANDASYLIQFDGR